MKLRNLNSGRILLVLSAIALTLALVSWDFKQSPGRFQQNRQVNDTTPKEKNKDREKKIRDLDDVLDELDRADMKVDMEKVEKEIAEAMKKIEKVDMGKIKMEIDKAMKEVDVEKLKQQIEESIAKIDWQQIKDEMEKAKNINMDKLQDEMKEVEKQMEKIGPQIKKEMEKAKVQIEKAKEEMNEYKEFVNGLDKDGLINKKESYTIKHKNGELTVNGKKVSNEVYSKYRSFLEKHKVFAIEKSDDDFNIDTDNDKD